MSPQHQLIYAVIKHHPGLNGDQIAAFIRKDPNGTRNIISYLRACGLIINKTKTSAKPGSYYIDKRRKIQ